MNTLRRTLHPETRVLDAKTGLVEYVASDETIDSYREIIRAAGWRFNHFARNAPFVDSHEYQTVEKLLGRVVDFKVAGKQLVETVQWAVDVAENKLAQLGWKMTEAGYLKAVSVGFWPTKLLTAAAKSFAGQLKELGLPVDAPVRTIYTEQEQIELSAVVIGANPNALAKSYKAGVLSDADLETLSIEYTQRFISPAAVEDALAAEHRARQRRAFVERISQIQKQL
jgi:hypothetical protein